MKRFLGIICIILLLPIELALLTLFLASMIAACVIVAAVIVLIGIVIVAAALALAILFVINLPSIGIFLCMQDMQEKSAKKRRNEEHYSERHKHG